MLEQLRAIRNQLAMFSDNIATLLKEREEFIKRLEALQKENEQLKRELNK